MKTIKSLTLAALALLASGPLMAQMDKKNVADKLFSDVVGTWRIETIYDGKKDITSKDTTEIQWLEFEGDGRYKSVTGTHATDSGSYRANENQRVLYLQSDLDKDNPVEWKVDLKDNNMTLSQQKGNAHAKRFRYVYIKTKDQSTKNKPVKLQQ